MTENQIKTVGQTILGLMAGLQSLRWMGMLWAKQSYPSNVSAYVRLGLALFICLLCLTKDRRIA